MVSSAEQQVGADPATHQERPGIGTLVLILAAGNLVVILVSELATAVLSSGGGGWWATFSSLFVAAVAGAIAGWLVIALRGGAMVLLALALLLVLQASVSAWGFSTVGSGYASWVATSAPEAHWVWRWSGIAGAISAALVGRWALQRASR